MFDVCNDLQTFYDTHVRLGKTERDRLAELRDLNLARLRDGLDDLAKEINRVRPHFYDWLNQGSYAMHTLNQVQHDDYDIDVGLLFNKSDLPDNPLEARQRVRDALMKRCTNFTKEPEARTNATTVWYADGYHVDFAIYRTFSDAFGVTHTEHASTEWKQRDPSEVNDWFTQQVTSHSPKSNPLIGYYPKVKDGQLRRIVRFLKWFCGSREGWSLPGGMVTSTLVVENYQADPDRDDHALYSTMVRVRDRLNVYTKVFNPVVTSQELTGSTEVANQVVRLRDQLTGVIAELKVLFRSDCTREQARFAWDWVFNHVFWATKEASTKNGASYVTESLLYSAKILCGLAGSRGGRIYREYPSGSAMLPKGVYLKFSLVSTDVPPPYTVRWIVTNHGDEATEAHQLRWEKTQETAHWTSTLYKGTHQMTCQIEKGGRLLAKTVHSVKIKPGKSRGYWQ